MTRVESITDAADKLAKYWETYNNQVGVEDYSTDIFLKDALYGIAIAINKPLYSYAGGFDRFLSDLRNWLEQQEAA